MIDVAVLGAGLAGLSAARDLALGGADVVVLEARDRPGGRVEAVELAPGVSVQAGGEVIGSEHRAYRELVEELGLTIEPSYVVDPGEMSWGLHEGVFVGDELPWMSAAERADAARVERSFARLAASVDPDDPWSHPEARRLDSLSLGDWLRSEGASPAVLRRHELASLSLACDSPDRTSLLAELRKHATLAGDGFYDLEAWEGLRVAEGSAAVALRMASELGERVRYGAVVVSVSVERGGGVRVVLSSGEELRAETVVCALPAGPLRSVRVSGLSDERLASLHAQRHALAAKVVVAYDEPFWQRAGQNGLAESEWLFGSTWPQRPGVLSLLVPPERLSALSGRAGGRAPRGGARAGWRAVRGSRRWRRWRCSSGRGGWTRSPRATSPCGPPGTCSGSGRCTGTHEPPFYVAGSDHWVAGYMEGAVRTGRAAARAALGVGSAL